MNFVSSSPAASRWQPIALLLVAPVLASLLLAIPFAVVTADASFSAWLRLEEICALPEEIPGGVR